MPHAQGGSRSDGIRRREERGNARAGGRARVFARESEGLGVGKRGMGRRAWVFAWEGAGLVVGT